MKKTDKIVFGCILTSAATGIGMIAYGLVLMQKEKTAMQLEKDAKHYANTTAIKMFLCGCIESKEQLETEWQFAYMNYRAYH